MHILAPESTAIDCSWDHCLVLSLSQLPETLMGGDIHTAGGQGEGQVSEVVCPEGDSSDVT